MKKPRLPELLERARQGDEDAILQIIRLLEPEIRRDALMVGDDDARAALIEWLIGAIPKYPGPPRLE